MKIKKKHKDLLTSKNKLKIIVMRANNWKIRVKK